MVKEIRKEYEIVISAKNFKEVLEYLNQFDDVNEVNINFFENGLNNYLDNGSDLLKNEKEYRCNIVIKEVSYG